MDCREQNRLDALVQDLWEDQVNEMEDLSYFRVHQADNCKQELVVGKAAERVAGKDLEAADTVVGTELEAAELEACSNQSLTMEEAQAFHLTQRLPTRLHLQSAMDQHAVFPHSSSSCECKLPST